MGCNFLIISKLCVQLKLIYNIFIQGRTNKLVDGCYSFWQGGIFPVIHSILQMYSDENLSNTNWMFDQSKNNFKDLKFFYPFSLSRSINDNLYLVLLETMFYVALHFKYTNYSN